MIATRAKKKRLHHGGLKGIPSAGTSKCEGEPAGHLLRSLFSEERLMSRFLTAMLSIAFLASATSGASAKMCRDAHGKFMKCPAPMMMKHKICRDKKGHFMKCPMMMHKM